MVLRTARERTRRYLTWYRPKGASGQLENRSIILEQNEKSGRKLPKSRTGLRLGSSGGVLYDLHEKNGSEVLVD